MAFSAARMTALEPLIHQVTDEVVEDLSARTPPTDFHEVVSFPLPARVICHFLGVPLTDIADFRAWSDDWTLMADDTKARHGMQSLRSYVASVVANRAISPGDGLLAALLAYEDEAGRLTESEVIALVTTLLFAGHETTVAAINKGILLLLTHRNAYEHLLMDRSAAPGAVEEILRSRHPLPRDPKHETIGLVRFAHTDIEIADVTIRSGDLVLLKKPDANQDRDVFPEPETFDITRSKNPHLAFGHGARYCPGAPLARLEMQALLERLPARLPTLRLAVPLEQLRLKAAMLTTRPTEVPVTW